MSETTSSLQMRLSYERMRQGDPIAKDEFYALACGRLMALARKIKADFPGPGKLVETGDVLSDAYLRLHRSLEQLDPPTIKDFFALTALKIRQVLLDLCDKIKQPGFAIYGGRSGLSQFEISDSTFVPPKILEWGDFHNSVSQLQDNERQVVDLLWYHDLTPPEAAEVLQVDATTIRRRWRSALLNLAKLTGFDEMLQKSGK